MERRQFLKRIVAGHLALSTSALLQAKSVSKRPPNIVLIMADDLGWNELGCYGQTKIKTPHIDRLASEGMKLNQYYAGSAVCAPSRCNLMTGMHGGHAYVRDNQEVKNSTPGRYGGQTPIPSDVPSIAETLKTHGYKTGCFGKWGLGGQGTSGESSESGIRSFLRIQLSTPCP